MMEGTFPHSPKDTLGIRTLLLPSPTTVFGEGMEPGYKFSPNFRPVIVFLLQLLPLSYNQTAACKLE